MKNFDDFKKYLDEKGLKIDGYVLSVFKIYHEWRQEEEAQLDGKKIQEAVVKALRTNERRNGLE